MATSAPPAPVATTKWQGIYPIYINAKKTQAEGRRIAISKAVDNPTLQEIEEVCKYLTLNYVVEKDKAYSRDYMERGRIRVLIKKDGVPVNPDIPNKHVLLQRIAALIKRMTKRAQQPSSGTAGAAAAAADSPAPATAATSGGGGGGGGSGKKKKGRR